MVSFSASRPPLNLRVIPLPFLGKHIETFFLESKIASLIFAMHDFGPKKLVGSHTNAEKK